DMVTLDETGLSIPPHARPLTRMVARAFDAYDQSKAKHSAAI
ncbi:MAG: oxygen-independent coproporphyrinogen oxidase, partial [Pseudomonadota bacterium]